LLFWSFNATADRFLVLVGVPDEVPKKINSIYYYLFKIEVICQD